MDPVSQLNQALSEVPWNVAQSAEDNVRQLPEILEESEPGRYPQIIQQLTRPIPGLRRLKIYYPVGEDEYYHPVEYVTQRDIAPIEVLNSISQFYDQPFTQANADALSQMMGRSPFEVQAGDRAADTLGGHVFFEGLIPHQDGYTLNLGS